MKVAEQFAEFSSYFDVLKKKYRWRIDNGSLMLIAAQFVGKKEAFEIERFSWLVNYIKEEASPFSYLQSTLRYSMGSLLIQEYDDPKAAFKEMQNCYEILMQKGFQRSPYTHIAAFTLFSQMTKGESVEAHAERAKEIFDGMKKNHYLLTSHEDYPLAVLLAESKMDPSHLLDDLSFYFDGLGAGFWKGNQRQFLAQILTYGQHDQREEVLKRTKEWIEALKHERIRFRGIHFPVSGVLSLIGSPDTMLKEIMEVYRMISTDSRFRWSKEYALLIAVQFVAKQEVDEHLHAETGLAADLDSILQAKQATLIAAITASTAAVATSNNSG